MLITFENMNICIYDIKKLHKYEMRLNIDKER